MKISVLIPTFNRKEMVNEAIQLICKYDDESVHEIIVSENHGDDGTCEFLAKKYAKNQKIKITKPLFKGSAIDNWQHCLNLATGTHVHWHWSDDYLEGGIYSMARKSHEAEGAEVILFGAKIVENKNIRWHYKYLDNTMTIKDALEKLINFELPLSPAAYIIPIESARRHFYTDIPDYETYQPMALAMGTDALMIAGSIKDHGSLKTCSETMMIFRSHSESITTKNINQLLNYRIAFVHFLKKNPDMRLQLLNIRKKIGKKLFDSIFFEKAVFFKKAGFLTNHLYFYYINKYNLFS